MKRIIEKISEILNVVFGYGIMICLFAGGFTFFGYVVALFIGGDIASEICTVIYKNVIPVIIIISNSLVLVGLVNMYLNGEVSLVISKKYKK